MINTTVHVQSTETTTPSFVYVLIGTLAIVLGLFGVFENGMVIYLYIRFKLHCITNMFIACLAFSDMCMLLVGIPVVVISAFYQKWIFRDIGCQLYGFIMSVLGFWSISIICLIAMDRYIMIVKCGRGYTITKKTAQFLVTIVFVISLVVALCPLLGFGSYALEGIRISCAPHWSSRTTSSVGFIWTIFWMYLFLPLTMNTFIYLRIFLRVKRKSGFIQRQAWVREVRVGFIAFLTLVVFLASWSPYAFVSIWRVVDKKSHIPLLVETLPAIFAKLSCSWNPLIYVCRNREFKKAFKQVFLCTHRRGLQSSAMNHTTETSERSLTRLSNSSLATSQKLVSNVTGDSAQLLHKNKDRHKVQKSSFTNEVTLTDRRGVEVTLVQTLTAQNGAENKAFHPTGHESDRFNNENMNCECHCETDETNVEIYYGQESIV